MSYILDTNIWLDWFVFRHIPSGSDATTNAHHPMERLIQHLTDPTYDTTIFMHPDMLAEWQEVLSRDKFALPIAMQTEIVAQTRALVQLLPVAPPVHLSPKQARQRIRCADPKDQIFIDTAVQIGARYLISKDKHLLALKKRAAPHRVAILTPEEWANAHPVVLPPPSQI